MMLLRSTWEFGIYGADTLTPGSVADYPESRRQNGNIAAGTCLMLGSLFSGGSSNSTPNTATGSGKVVTGGKNNEAGGVQLTDNAKLVSPGALDLGTNAKVNAGGIDVQGGSGTVTINSADAGVLSDALKSALTALTNVSAVAATAGQSAPQTVTSTAPPAADTTSATDTTATATSPWWKPALIGIGVLVAIYFWKD